MRFIVFLCFILFAYYLLNNGIEILKKSNEKNFEVISDNCQVNKYSDFCIVRMVKKDHLGCIDKFYGEECDRIMSQCAGLRVNDVCRVYFDKEELIRNVRMLEKENIYLFVGGISCIFLSLLILIKMHKMQYGKIKQD